MLKKIYMVIIVGMVVVSMVGCDKDKEDQSSKTTIGDIKKSSTVAGFDTKVETPIEASDTSEGIVVENTVSNKNASSDPFGMYLVPEGWAQYGLFMEKDGKLYSMDSTVPVSVIDEYGVGVRAGKEVKEANLYLMDSGKVGILPTNTPKAYVSAGDVPLLKVSKSDKVIAYGIQRIELTETSFAGYTIDAHERAFGSLEFMPTIDHTLIPTDGEIANQSKHDFGIFDANENQVEDFRNLTYGEEYTFTWYSGTECHQIVKVADCHCYPIDESVSAKTYTIKGSLTKNGYAEFDLSEVDPGIYTCGGSVFEVVD